MWGILELKIGQHGINYRIEILKNKRQGRY